MYLGPSFRDSVRRNGRFLFESHTLCPGRSDGPIRWCRLAFFCCSRDEFNRAARAFQTSWELHVLGLFESRHLRVFSISWFTLSVWPLDWGLNPEDKLMVEQIRRPKAFHNLEVNWEPLSDTISWGNPWILKTFCMRSSSVWLAVGILEAGIRWHALENLSTTSITVLPWELGRPQTKSMDMWDQGGL